MENSNDTRKPLNSKGAGIFKKILDDQKYVRERLKNGDDMGEILKELRRRNAALTPQEIEDIRMNRNL